MVYAGFMDKAGSKMDNKVRVWNRRFPIGRDDSQKLRRRIRFPDQLKDANAPIGIWGGVSFATKIVQFV